MSRNCGLDLLPTRTTWISALTLSLTFIANPILMLHLLHPRRKPHAHLTPPLWPSCHYLEFFECEPAQHIHAVVASDHNYACKEFVVALALAVCRQTGIMQDGWGWKRRQKITASVAAIGGMGGMRVYPHPIMNTDIT